MTARAPARTTLKALAIAALAAASLGSHAAKTLVYCS